MRFKCHLRFLSVLRKCLSVRTTYILINAYHVWVRAYHDHVMHIDPSFSSKQLLHVTFMPQGRISPGHPPAVNSVADIIPDGYNIRWVVWYNGFFLVRLL